ncbi:MAG: efflux RND transporter permease subunit, partial [Planctomycetes bacterium]|nr:efflux RND transporter permease subunit [Planctomycetota bacterium]
MVRRLIEWAVSSPLIVIMLALSLAVGGAYCFFHINVEAYPDPAPAIIEVVAQYPGASAEEVERQVTIPLEVTLAGMPGLKYTRSKSLFGLAHLRNQFDYGVDFYAARQEVINRLQQNPEPLPPGVTPQISPVTPTGELVRYTLSNPEDALHRPLYNLNDLKALEDWTLEREFKRVPRIIDVTSFGGTVKRYEIHPNPERLKHYGITLQQIQTAISNSNANAGGDYLVAGTTVQNVRGIGLIGGGVDPMHSRQVLGVQSKELQAWLGASPQLTPNDKYRIRAAFSGAPVNPPLSPEEQRRLQELHRTLGVKAAQQAAPYLRSEEERRLLALRQIVITSINNRPIRVDDIVEGGPLTLSTEEEIGREGVVVGHQTRFGMVSLTRPQRDDQDRPVLDKAGRPVWIDEDDKVMG